MKDKGIFSKLKNLLTRGPRVYPDPVLRPQVVVSKVREIKRAVLPCDPGTIVYHDMLVRKFGRFRADGYGRAIVAKDVKCLPTPAELQVRDWAWRT